MGFNSPSLNPENEQVQYLQKIALRAENPAVPSVFYYLDSFYFLHEVQFSAAIEAAHFPADLRNAALSTFEEGAPFMGTALAAHKQCIGAEVVCHFHLLIKRLPRTNISKYLEMSPKSRIFAALKSNQPKSNF